MLGLLEGLAYEANPFKFYLLGNIMRIRFWGTGGFNQRYVSQQGG